MKNFYLVLDTETGNSTGNVSDSDNMVYDLGYAVIDKKGHIYESHSFIISDIFYKRPHMMNSAYYNWKIPMYLKGIEKGEWEVISFSTAKFLVKEICEKWNIKAICAYNARFDVRALNTTQRFLTCSKYRYFIPYGIEIYDIWKMAQDTICKQKSYKKFCQKNGFFTKNGRLKTSAEVVFKYMEQNANYEECHTGLEDVKIEAQIMVKCFRQHKKMRTVLYS
jgi:hypothetical protein